MNVLFMVFRILNIIKSIGNTDCAAVVHALYGIFMSCQINVYSLYNKVISFLFRLEAGLQLNIDTKVSVRFFYFLSDFL